MWLPNGPIRLDTSIRNGVAMNIVTRYSTWLLIVTGLALMTNCSRVTEPQKPPSDSVSASALLLEPISFPDGWAGSPCDTSLCRQGGGGVTAAERDFYRAEAPGHVLQEVYRFLDNQAASHKFSVYRATDFDKPEMSFHYEPLAPPPEISFRSQIADEYYFACGVEDVPLCRMVARYRNFFVYIYFDHATEKNAGGLTYSQIEHVLEALETKVAQALDIPTSPEPK
jgi:hypothetical protein